jgi:hypothetical protein
VFFLYDFSSWCIITDAVCYHSIEDFAILEAGYTIVRILQRFPYLVLPKDEPHVPIGKEKQILTLVIASVDGCRVKLERNKQE